MQWPVPAMNGVLTCIEMEEEKENQTESAQGVLYEAKLRMVWRENKPRKPQ